MLQRILIFLLIWIAFVDCNIKNENPCELPEEVRTEIQKTDSLLMNPLIIERYGNWMKYNYDEPGLHEAEFETIRFKQNCIGGYRYTKIVRLEMRNRVVNVVFKEFNDTSSLYNMMGNIELFKLSTQDWMAIQEELKKLEFWTTFNLEEKHYLDGCSWSIEAYKPEADPCPLPNFHSIQFFYPVDSMYRSLYDLLSNPVPEE